MTSVHAEPDVSIEAPAAPPRTPSAGVGEFALAWAILLPPVLLAWPGPGSFLRRDMAPHISSAGIALLATLVPALFALARRSATRVRWLEAYLLPLLIGIAWLSSGHVSDTLEAARSVMLACTVLVLMLASASLGESARAIVTRGIVCVALAVILVALVDPAHGFAGELGNTGVTSQAALPGAVIGAWYAAGAGQQRASRAWRLAGALAWLGFTAHCALAPVVGTAAAFAVAIAAAVVCHRRLGRGARIALIGFGLVTPLAVGAAIDARSQARAPASGATADATAAAAGTTVDPGDSGGFFVRKSIDTRSVAMLRDHPWTGVGPGQFVAAFPPYRDPLEIELSSLGRKLGAETEVEHAHNDWLEVVLETGLIGGAGWIAFLCAAAAYAVRSLRRGSPDAAVRGAAAVSLLVCAVANATLTHHALSACIAFTLFGTLLAAPAAPRAPVSRRLVLLAAIALVVLCAPRASKFVAHGRALASFSDLVESKPDAATLELERALEACPDSVSAHSLHVRAAEASGRDAEAVADEWRTILSLRPYRFEAWMQLGFHAAVQGRDEEARTSFERALALDPRHPGLLENLITLELDTGRTSEALRYLAKLEALDVPVDAWIEESAARLTLAAHDETAEVLFARFDATLASGTADEDFARSKALRARDAQRDARSPERSHEHLADALESRAHRRWAREHAEAGRFHDAVRSYRQAFRRAAIGAGEAGAPRVRLELAAALLGADKEADAKAAVQGLVPSARDWQALPEWARTRLQATGWFAQ